MNIENSIGIIDSQIMHQGREKVAGGRKILANDLMVNFQEVSSNNLHSLFPVEREGVEIRKGCRKNRSDEGRIIEVLVREIFYSELTINLQRVPKSMIDQFAQKGRILLPKGRAGKD